MKKRSLRTLITLLTCFVMVFSGPVTILADSNEAEVVEESAPEEETETVEEAAPDEETENVEEAAPEEETETVEESAPDEDNALDEALSPVGGAAPAEEAAPAGGSTSDEILTPTEGADTAEETATAEDNTYDEVLTPATDADTDEDSESDEVLTPAADADADEETVPTEYNTSDEVLTPAADTDTDEETTPAEDTDPAAEASPAAEQSAVGGDAAGVKKEVIPNHVDADKYNAPNYDELLCWAATAANMLWNGGYAANAVNPLTNGKFKNVDEVFDYFRKCFTDEAGVPDGAIEYFMSGTYKYNGDEGISVLRDNAPAGGLLKDETYKTEITYLNKPGLIAAIEELKDITAGTLLHWWNVKKEDTTSGAHWLTVTELVKDSSGSGYAGIWLTDSDNDTVRPDNGPLTDDDTERARLASQMVNSKTYYPLTLERLGGSYYYIVNGFLEDSSIKAFITHICTLTNMITQKDTDSSDDDAAGENNAHEENSAPTENSVPAVDDYLPDSYFEENFDSWMEEYIQEYLDFLMDNYTEMKSASLMNNYSDVKFDSWTNDYFKKKMDSLIVEYLRKNNADNDPASDGTPQTFDNITKAEIMNQLYKDLKAMMVQKGLVVYSPTGNIFDINGNYIYGLVLRKPATTLINVYVDGKRIDMNERFYTVEINPEGLSTIRFNKEFLKSLGKGTHTIKLGFDTGNTVDTTITIQ